MKKLKEISIDEIIQGKNWKIHPSNDSIEIWEVEATETFDPKDCIAYSAIFVTDTGSVTPLILIKEVCDLDYGGDYVEYKNGKWQQLGIESNPNSSKGKDYIANPLFIDPSFDADDDYRKEHQDNFKKWIVKLNE